jgi:transposase
VNRIVLGIDVSKKDFHVALVGTDQRERTKAFPNNVKGFEQLAAWLRNRKVESAHACLEATGGWSEALATSLHDDGYAVSLVNPQRVKAFGKSEGLRTKTDAADAGLIARFCVAHTPDLWEPPRLAVRTLQSFSRRRASLIEIRTQESNRLEGPESTEDVRASLRAHIAYLDRDIEEIDERIKRTIEDDQDLRTQRDLIDSIPGFAPGSASSITAEIPDLKKFRDAKAVGAYVGLCPHERQSGTSLAQSHLSRVGNARLRHQLYFPALTAMRYNNVIRSFSERLLARGKKKMVVVAAAMRKLLVLAYGVVKSGRPWDPSLTT